MLLSLLVALLLSSAAPAWGQQLDLPPSGAYFSLSNAAIESVLATVTATVVNDINSYTAWPVESGSSSSASYTFQGWQVEVVMAQPQWKIIGYNQIALGWHEFNFTIESDYHVCATSWPNPCEDGYLYINTTDPFTSLYVDMNISLSENPAFINVSSSVLQFRSNGIEIWVQCTDTFCLIPTDDIANAVAQDFVPLFTTAVANAARKILLTHAASLKLVYEFTDGLGLDLTSDWWMLPGNTGGDNGFILAPTTGGFFTDVAGAVTYPPFNATFVPPSTLLNSPKEDFNIVICDYFFQSLLWALGDIGFFTRTITSSEVPAVSPVKLTTSDAFFQQVVPGLKSYPNMDITVDTALIVVSVPTITPQGVQVYGTNMSLDFSLSNSTFSQHGWTLNAQLDILLDVSATVTGNEIAFTGSIANFTSAVTVTETDVGTVLAAGFVSLFQLLEGVITIPSRSLTVPASFALSTGTLELYDHYMTFTANFTYEAAEIIYEKPIYTDNAKVSIVA